MTTLSSLASSRFLPQQINEVLRAFDTIPPKESSAMPQKIDIGSEDVVSLSAAGLALSKRAEALGNATIDTAQDMLASFATQLFGDSGKGLSISFDAASISAASQFAGAVQHSDSPNGTYDAAAFLIRESADFSGSGEITTADGQRYHFEIEVHYQLRMEGAAFSQTATAPVSRDSDNAITQAAQGGHHLRAQFPGTSAQLANLFENDKLKLFFHIPQPDAARPHDGMLTLHLLDRIDTAAEKTVSSNTHDAVPKKLNK